MTRTDRTAGVDTNIGKIVSALLDEKILPVLVDMPRKEAGVKIGMNPAALMHYFKTGDDRVSLPQLPTLERLAATAGFTINVTLKKDAEGAAAIIGDIDPETWALQKRGRKPGAPKPEKVAKERPKPVLVSKPKPKPEPVAEKPKKAVAEKPAKKEAKPATKPAKGKVTVTSELAAPKAKPTPKAAPAKKATAKAVAPKKKGAVGF